MTNKNLGHEILVGLTGRNFIEIKKKIIECDELGIKRVALFLEFLSKNKKREVYEFLLNSRIKEIPFVHIRNDIDSEELKFLEKNFKTRYFNIHTNSFQYIKKWNGSYNKILLELGYRNQIPNKKDFNKLAGFCIDLSHFKAGKERRKKEYFFTMQYKNKPQKFIANHLNGYSKFWKKDLHKIKKYSQLDYLLDLPKFIFGRYIALEMFNPIKEQLDYKSYIKGLLKGKIKVV